MSKGTRCSHHATVKNIGRSQEMQCNWESIEGRNYCPLHEPEEAELEPKLHISNILQGLNSQLSPATPRDFSTSFLDVELGDVHLTRNDISALSDSRRGDRIVFLGCDIRDLHIRRIDLNSKLVFEDCNIERIDIITTTECEMVFRDCKISELGLNGEMTDVRVQECEIERYLEIRGAVRKLDIQDTCATTDSAHCLISGEISTGVLAQPSDGNLAYIADDATIGDVNLENADPPLQQNYWFSCEIETKPFESELDEQTYIEVVGEVDDVVFRGDTSVDNWGRRSHIVQTVRAAKRGETYPYQGLLTPVSKTEEDGGTEEYDVNFLIICGPKTELKEEWYDRQYL